MTVGRTTLAFGLLLAVLAAACQAPAHAPARAPTPTSRNATTIGTELPATAVTGTAMPAASPVTTDLVAQGYRILLRRLVLPVAPADLLNGAWFGATAEARREAAISPPAPPQFGSDSDQALTDFQSAIGTLLAAGNGKLDQTAIERAALISMAESVDDCHTAYLTADQWQSIADDLAGKEVIDGLPLTFQLQSPYLIETVVSGSNADKQGVRPGDRIIGFNGAALDSIPLSQRKFLTTGAEGTTAQLELESPSGNRRTVAVTREDVTRPVVMSQIVGPVGYIRVRTFTTNLGGMLDSTFSSLQSQGARGFVLDLRGNLGGEEDSDVQLMSRFIPSGLLTSSIGRSGRSDDVRASGNVLPGPPPLAVLVDGGSLSASELLAEAIKQFHAGEIIGTSTPGCLQGSTFQSLDDGSSMQATVVTVTVGPARTVVNNVGVQPDVVVPIQAADFASGRDPQRDRAIADVTAQIGP